MADIVGDHQAEDREPYMPWWAEYGGAIRAAFMVTVVVVGTYIAVHHGWLP